MNPDRISQHLKKMNLARAGPPPPRIRWQAGKPPDLAILDKEKTTKTKNREEESVTKRSKEMNAKKRLGTITGLIISALLFAVTLLPATALAATPAGTVISNTATVTWAGGSASDSADITVNFLEVTPALTHVSTAPASPVAEGTAMTITYTLASAANGLDTYTLGSSIANNPGASFVSTPTTTVNGGTTSVDLGASQVLSVTETATDTIITLPAGSAAHGLVAGSTVLINGSPYTVDTVTDATPSITVAGTGLGFNPGDLIQEQITFTVTFTTDILTGATGDHDVTTTAGNGVTADASDQQTVTVNAAALTITKTADPTNAQPGDTVTYKIVVENTGAVDATSVQVTDSIPALYTTYVNNSARWNNAVAATYAGSAGNTLTDASDSPTDEYDFTAGTATYSVGTMAPAEVAVLFFQVQVQ